MGNTTLIFSNNDFMANKVFYDLLMKWDRYNDSPECLEVILLEIYREAIFWYDIFKDATWWREDLR